MFSNQPSQTSDVIGAVVKGGDVAIEFVVPTCLVPVVTILLVDFFDRLQTIG